MVVHSGIHVFVNNRKISVPSNRIKGPDILRLAGFIEREHWDLYRLKSETDASVVPLSEPARCSILKMGTGFA